MDRVIFHCDLNSFYASVELLSHPELRHRPVAVCGDPNSRHGIILAKNEPAKAFQVKTAETIWQARKKCPELLLLPPHHRLYREYSRKVNAIYDEYTDLVEPFGIDESWLDVTHTLHLFGMDAGALADALRRRVRKPAFSSFLHREEALACPMLVIWLMSPTVASWRHSWSSTRAWRGVSPSACTTGSSRRLVLAFRVWKMARTEMRSSSFTESPPDIFALHILAGAPPRCQGGLYAVHILFTGAKRGGANPSPAVLFSS